MLYSMTGFGRAELSHEQVRISVVVKSVNHKALDIRMMLPPVLSELEVELTSWLRTQVGRGRLELRIDLQGVSTRSAELDVMTAELLHRDLQGLCVRLGISEPVSLSHLLSSQAVWRPREQGSTPSLFEPVKRAVAMAIDSLSQSRLREGLALEEDLALHLDVFEDRLLKAAGQAPKRLDEYREKLQAKIASFMPEGVEVDGQRIAMEVALFADRADVNEELSRAKVHIDELRSLLSCESSPIERVGKRIDFFLQELNREVNTLASKSRDAALTTLTIDMKSELESMREQTANIQ